MKRTHERQSGWHIDPRRLKRQGSSLAVDLGLHCTRSPAVASSAFARTRASAHLDLAAIRYEVMRTAGSIRSAAGAVWSVSTAALSSAPARGAPEKESLVFLASGPGGSPAWAEPEAPASPEPGWHRVRARCALSGALTKCRAGKNSGPTRTTAALHHQLALAWSIFFLAASPASWILLPAW
jgi:hypothetical protein